MLQSVEYFRRQGALDVGTEIRPNFTDVTLMVNLGFFISVVVLLLTTVERGRGDCDERATTDGQRMPSPSPPPPSQCSIC